MLSTTASEFSHFSEIKAQCNWHMIGGLLLLKFNTYGELAALQIWQLLNHGERASFKRNQGV